MTERTTMQPGLDLSERGDAAYRAVSPWAMAGLALGAVSLVSLLHPLLLVVPVLATLTAIQGWRKVEGDPGVWAGRGLAIAGLVLAVFGGASGFARHYSRHAELMSQADALAMEWFGYLAANEPLKAHQLSQEPAQRLPLDDNLWRAYKNSDKLNSALRTTVQQGPVRALLALGDKARVRPYAVTDQLHNRTTDSIERVFAVTFEQDGKTKTFFMQLALFRTIDQQSGVVGWQTGTLAKGPIFPEGFVRPGQAGKR